MDLFPIFGGDEIDHGQLHAFQVREDRVGEMQVEEVAWHAVPHAGTTPGVARHALLRCSRGTTGGLARRVAIVQAALLQINRAFKELSGLSAKSLHRA